MTILIVPDGFKDSLGSQEVAKAMRQGVLSLDSNAITHSVYASDGGDGFLNAVSHYKPDLIRITAPTVNPLGNAITAHYLFDTATQTAYIELAAASGIELLKSKDRRVMHTSTVGTGLQMQDAVKRGAKRLFIGLGGSATNDAAIGLASVLGFQFLDINEDVLEPCGKNLKKIAVINKTTNQYDHIEIIAINDVLNPLFGPKGAAFSYAKQKGASPEDIVTLDAGLEHLHGVVYKSLKKDAATIKGAGAAGGTAYGLKVFFNANFESGTKFILELSNFYTILEQQKVDFIMTGEGCIDNQTVYGKLVKGVIGEGKKRNIPVMAVCGKLNLTTALWKQLGLTDVRELFNPALPKEYSYTHAAKLIAKVTTAMLKSNS
jgi:glycerate kinase